jgi:hypothetical protein
MQINCQSKKISTENQIAAIIMAIGGQERALET